MTRRAVQLPPVSRLAPLLLASWLLASAASAAQFQFGVCTHVALRRVDADDARSLVTAAGFGGIRDDVFWGALESEKGALRFPAKYADLRRAFRDAAPGGESIAVLGLGNRHYDGGGLPTSDEAIAGFARYARFVAGELAPHVRQFEVWNEWNTGFGAKRKTGAGDARAYARLLGPAAGAIRAANPDARVIGGVTAGVDLEWFRALAEAGGLRDLDAVSVHSYTLFRRAPNPEGAIASLDKLHVLLERAEPRRTLPIYITEIGWPTNAGKHGVSDREAAGYLVRFTLLARTRPWIGGVWWYDLVDDGDADARSEHRFGLVRRGGAPKEAYFAAQALAPLLRASAAPRAYRFGTGGYLVTGGEGAGRWAVAWHMSDEFLAWDAGSTREAAVPDALAALGERLPPDGSPVLYRHDGARWRLDSRWLADTAKLPARAGDGA